MFKNILILISVFPCIAFAKYLTGEGEFLSVETDSPGFVKSQLVYSAKKNILNDYLNSLDLSPQDFWQGFENKISTNLEKRLESIENQITKQRENKDFDKILELETKKRSLILSKRAKLLDRARVFTSYSILERSQSVGNPSLKFIKMKVKINRNLLKRFLQAD